MIRQNKLFITKSAGGFCETAMAILEMDHTDQTFFDHGTCRMFLFDMLDDRLSGNVAGESQNILSDVRNIRSR